MIVFSDTKTERLLLRKIRESDIDDIYEYTSNPVSSQFLHWSYHRDHKPTIQFVNEVTKQYREFAGIFVYGIELISERKLIGLIRLFDMSTANSRVEVSYILNPNYQGKGYMREALEGVLTYCFNNKLFRRVQARCSVDNLSSEKLMKSVGMVCEGLLRSYWIVKGKEKDVKIYSILISDK